MYEYGISKAASCNCPTTVMINFPDVTENPRIDDVLEVLYRWEDVKRKKWLTQEQKELLKNPEQEYILLVNEKGEYELLPYFRIKNAAKGNKLLSAYYFERLGRTYVVCWHTEGSGELLLPFKSDDFVYEEQLGKNSVEVKRTEDGVMIPVSGRRYFSSPHSKEEIIRAFENADFVDAEQ